jgi:iduronate 2-sulfatase
LLTGFRPQSLGIYDLATNFRRAAPTVRTLPQLFRDGGFHASALGKIFHVGHGNHDDEASWDEPLFRGKTVQYQLPENRGPSREEARFEGLSAEKLPRGSATESARVDDEAYDDGRIAAEAVRRIRAAAATPGKPFFLAVGFLRPHLPFVAPKRYWDLHDPDALPRPETTVAPIGAPPYASSDWGELRQYKDAPDKGPVDEALARRLVHGYYAAASFMDAQVGKLLDALDDTGLADDTIVVLWGDHGWHLGDHGLWCKHTNYEQATRIPLIVSAPGMRRGEATAALIDVSMGDVAAVRRVARQKFRIDDTATLPWLDALLRASVFDAIGEGDRAQQVLAAMPCDDYRRRFLAGDPLLRLLRIPARCQVSRPPTSTG